MMPRREAQTTALLALALLIGACGGHDEHAEDAENAGEHGDDDEDGAEIHLDADQVAALDLRVETAGPGEIAAVLRLAAVVQPNLDATVHVNPRVPGIVRSIAKRLGDAVEPGEQLCEIESVELARAVSEHLAAHARVDAAERTLAQERELFAQRIAAETRVLDGEIDAQRTLLERERELRADALTTLRPVLDLERAVGAAELRKEGELTGLRTARDARLVELEAELRERRIALDASANLLRALGIAPEQADGLAASDESTPEGRALLEGRYAIRASLAGVVVARHITAGEYVDNQTRLYEIEDLSSAWIVAAAYEEDLRSLRVGQEARVHLDAFPAEEFVGSVSLIDYRVDPESRSIGVRVDLLNTPVASWGEALPMRPGMYGNVEIVVDRRQAALVLPEIAVVHEGREDLVFVRVGAGEFELRPVELGLADAERVEILSGVAPGEEVVVEGAFALKSIARGAELGGGHSH